MLDLKAQLGDYLNHVVERVDLEDLFEERDGSLVGLEFRDDAFIPHDRPTPPHTLCPPQMAAR